MIGVEFVIQENETKYIHNRVLSETSHASTQPQWHIMKFSLPILLKDGNLIAPWKFVFFMCY